MIATICWIVCYLAIACGCVFLVRYIGPITIEYVLEETYDKTSGPINVLYRIVSPALCSETILLLLSAVTGMLGCNPPKHMWLPVLFYWVILLMMKLACKKMTRPWYAFALEGSASIAIATLLDSFVLQRLSAGDLSALDGSNIAFEMELALLYVLIQAIVTAMTRYQYKIRIRTSHTAANEKPETEDRSSTSKYNLAIDVSEAKLYEYGRKYSPLLPERFMHDPLLWDIFFTIMAIEDGNRPSVIRAFERAACTLGLAKTTGIMQQKSDKPLSDEESVVLAAAYIEKMWDRFLAGFARSREGGFSPRTICFGATWYSYDYAAVARALGRSFNSFYGDYCGTRLLNAAAVFEEVRRFEERERYGLTKDAVIARGSILPMHSGWLSSQPFYWEDGHTIRSKTPPALNGGDAPYEFHSISIDANEIAELCADLKQLGASIYSVTFAEQAYATVRCIGGNAIESLNRPNWTRRKTNTPT